jgi:hypothetical protein
MHLGGPVFFALRQVSGNGLDVPQFLRQSQLIEARTVNFRRQISHRFCRCLASGDFNVSLREYISRDCQRLVSMMNTPCRSLSLRRKSFITWIRTLRRLSFPMFTTSPGLTLMNSTRVVVMFTSRGEVSCRRPGCCSIVERLVKSEN